MPADEPTANDHDSRDRTGRRETVTVITVYATPWHLRTGEHRETTSPSDQPWLERLEKRAAGSAAQLPRVLFRTDLDAEDLRFQRHDHSRAPITEARMWLFTTPSDQIIVALGLDLDCEPLQTIDLLEDCYHLQARYGGASIETVAATLTVRHGGDTAPGQTFFPERHQVVFGPALPSERSEDIVQRVVYRSDLPYRHEFSTIACPPELNRHPDTTGAVGPSVSLVCGHREHVEHGVFLSVIQAVAGAAWLRDIRNAAYSAVETFRGGRPDHPDTRPRRRVLGRLSNQIGDMELDLSYGVEAGADLGLMAPLLRVADYHEALYDAMGLVAKAETVTRMLHRLARAIDAELTAIEGIERRIDENHRLRWAIAAGFISTVPVPISLVFAFFGIQAAEIDHERSMWDLETYLPVYLFAMSLVAIGVLLFIALYLYQRRSLRRDLHPDDDS